MDLDLSSAFANLPFGTGSNTLPDLSAAMADDPALDEMVRAFAALGAEQAGEIGARVEAILLRWTRADTAQPDSRGQGINARWLQAMEVLAGAAWTSAAAEDAPLLAAAWNQALGDATTRLLGQTALGRAILPGLVAGPVGSFQVQDGTSLDAVLGHAAGLAPGDAAGRLSYWRVVADSLVRHGPALGATQAQVLAALDPVLAAQGVGLTAQDLLDALFARPSAGGWAVSGQTDRVLIAAGGDARLVGSSGADRFIVAGPAGTVTLVDSVGSDRLDLRGWTRAQTSVATRVVQHQPGAEAGALLAHYELTLQQGERRVIIPVTLRDGRVEAAAEQVLFDDGALNLLDLVSLGSGIVVGLDGPNHAFADNPAAELLIGRSASDSYTLSAGSGRDLIMDRAGAAHGDDTVRIDALPADVAFASSGAGLTDLVVRIAGTEAAVTVLDQFGPAGPAVESFTFSDGTRLSAAQVQARITTGTALAESVQGTAGDDRIDGGGGADLLAGGPGADTYLYRPGYGPAVIADSDGLGTIRIEGAVTLGDLEVVILADGLRIGVGSGSDAIFLRGLTFADQLRLTIGDQQVALADLLIDQARRPQSGIAGTAADGTQWGQTALGGDAGNDVLIGTSAADSYVFGRGYGHDVIKEQEGPDGASSSDDVLTLAGLNPADVSFARAAFDPLSIVMTIHDTGETLTLDGTPFDGSQAGAAVGSRPGAQGVDRVVFADGTVLSLAAIEQAILDAERTAGADLLESFGGAAMLDGGTGNDTYLNQFSAVAVRLAAGGGSDRIINRNLGPMQVTVSLAGLDAADLLVLFEQRDGRAVTVLRARSGEELVVDGRPGSQELAIRVLDAAGSAHAVLAEGAVIAGQAASDGDDYLTGQTTSDDLFHPGKGDDVIAGRGGSDTVVFNAGDGADTLLRHDAAPGRYTLQLGAGLAPSDLGWTWLNEGSHAVRLSFNASGDSVTVDARHAGTLAFADGTVLRVGDWASLAVSLAPGATVLANAGSDDSFTATFGAVQVALGAGSGQDRFRDASLADAGGTLLQPPAGWRGSALLLEGGTSLDDFEFVQDSSAPTNLVVRNLRTGSSLVVEGQFASEILLQASSGWLSPDSTGDGAADWAALDLDGDGAADFARLDSNGDGAPDWDKADFDGDGRSDWQHFTLLTLDADGDGTTDVYAYDADGDRAVDTYDFVLTPTAARPNANGITFRDANGDGQVDEYSTDYATFTALPRDAGGGIAWGAVDTNLDGLADTAALDSNGDGAPEWQSPDRNGDGISDWRNESIADLYDLSGRFVASQKVSARGQVVYQVDGSQGGLLARDSDGEGTPDAVARDADYDFQADPLPPFHPVDSLQLAVKNPDGTVTVTTSAWSQIAPRVILRDEGTGDTGSSIDLFNARPAATPGSDVLVVRSGETVDGLAGNDRIHTDEGGATIRFGRGSGSDTVLADLPHGAAANAVVFTNVQSPTEIEVLRSPGDPADLVIRIRDTGEELRIAGQWRRSADGSTVAMVESFTFANGERFSQAQMLTLVSGAYLAGDDSLTSGVNGGLLDGGAGADRLFGGPGDDVYRFGRSYGADRIGDAGGTDRVEFGPGIALTDLAFARTGADHGDLRVTVAGEESLSLTIAGQFLPGPSRIETFRFTDGSMLSAAAIEALLLDHAATSGDDRIVGFGGADVLRGLAGNDWLSGGGSNDAIEGGLGRDTATYRGAASDYDVVTVGGVTTVTDRMAGRDGTDQLRGVEELYFAGAGGTTVLLVPPNRAPEVGDLSASGSEDSEVVIARSALMALAIDPDGDSLELSLGAARNGAVWFAEDGSIRFRPDPDFNGTAGFDYIVRDGNGAEATARVILALAPVNDAPVISAEFAGGAGVEDQPLRLAIPVGLFSDRDGDAVTVGVRQAGGAALPAWLSFTDGVLSGTPPRDFSGTLALELAGSDGTATTSHPFTVVIAAVNDAPQLVQPLPDRTAAIDAVFSLALPAGSFADVDGDALVLSASRADGSALPAWLAFDAASGTFSGRPGSGDLGSLAVVVRASDPAGASASGVFTLTVADGNDAPLVNGRIADLATPEDAPFRLVLPADLFTDPDLGDSLSLAVARADGTALPGWLRFDPVGRTLWGTPLNDDVGAIGLVVSATDRAGASAATGFVLTVSNVNDAPLAGDDLLYNVTSNSKATMLLADLFANDSDADGDGLTLVRFSAPGHGTATRDAQGSLVYTPKRGFTGTDSMTYTVSDGQATATATIAITVVGNNPYAGWRRGKSHDDQLTGNATSANRIYGAGGDDRITGGALGDQLSGGTGDDALYGLGGNDFLEGNAGDDTLSGGAGIDTAVFSGLKSSYVVRTSAGQVQIVDTAPGVYGDDGSDTLYGMEKAVFRNGGLLALAAPVVLDLDGDGVELVARGASSGATQFDWDGDGRADPSGWIGRDDGFLAYDRNGDGTVSNAGELSFVADKAGARSDLDGLSAFDSNGDGMISAADERYGGFHVWRDGNGDGRVDAGEFLTLAQAGVASVSLAGQAVDRDWGLDDNLVVNRGSYTRSDGSTAALADVALNYAAGPDRAERLGVRPFSGVAFDDPAVSPAAIQRAASRLVEAIAGFAADGGTGDLADFARSADRPEPLFAASARLSAW